MKNSGDTYGAGKPQTRFKQISKIMPMHLQEMDEAGGQS